MTNYENQKTAIDNLLQDNRDIAVNKDTNKVTDCNGFNCGKCLFYDNTRPSNCFINRIKWLVAEYKEPEIDWGNISIDTPVLVSEDGVVWHHRHFAGISKEDSCPSVWLNGLTSWTAIGNAVSYPYIKLVKLPYSPETEE